MLKNKYLTSLVMVILCLCAVACSDDDKSTVPTFSQIKIEPQKDVYHVGDVVTCSIERLSTGSGDLRAASYWWYTSWWFKDSEIRADFEDFDTAGTNTSQPITLTEAGTVTLYFFGRLEYPNWDWQKIEIPLTITVVE